jgi:streptogramin lyase
VLIAVAVGALALLLLAPSGALAAKKKLSVKVASSSQTQVSNQGALKVSFKAKGLSKVSASATATPDGGSQVSFASKASKNNPKQGTLSLPLTADGQAALDDCVSLSLKVKASGSGKSANASAVLAEDDPECAKPVKEFDLETSASYPAGITVGSDNNIWFTQIGAGENALGRVTTDGDYDMFPIPVPAGADPGAFGGHMIGDVVTGPDGDIWASPDSLGTVGVVRHIDPATGDVSEFELPTNPGIGSKIAVGPDDALWLTSQTNELMRVTTSGDVTEFPLSDPNFPDVSLTPYGIAAGGDGNIWFSTPFLGTPGVAGTVGLGRLDPDTGETTFFPLSGGPNPIEGIGYLTTDAAGRIWFADAGRGAIGRIDPQAPTPQIVEFAIPTPNSKPVGVAFAPDGSIWFTEQNADNIGRYDPASGLFTEYPLETLGSLPFDITVGPDGKIYFTEMGTGKVGQLDPNKAPAGDPNPSDGKSQPPFAVKGQCELANLFLCQQQVNLTGSTFDIGTALHQELPPETLKLTGGIVFTGGPPALVPPPVGPMLEAKPLDVEVAGTPATTKIGLAGPPNLTSLIPIAVTVPIDLYVSQPGNPAGGCVIGPVIQNLAQVNDAEGDSGSPLAGDIIMASVGTPGNLTIAGLGTFEDTTFSVPEARGCGALTDIINNVLSLPSDPGNNATRLPFSQLLTGL